MRMSGNLCRAGIFQTSQVQEGRDSFPEVHGKGSEGFSGARGQCAWLYPVPRKFIPVCAPAWALVPPPAPGLAPEHGPPSPASLPQPFWTAPQSPAALQMPFWSHLSLVRLFPGGWSFASLPTGPHPLASSSPASRSPRPDHAGRSEPWGLRVQNGRLDLVVCRSEPSCTVFKRTWTTLRPLGKPMSRWGDGVWKWLISGQRYLESVGTVQRVRHIWPPETASYGKQMGRGEVSLGLGEALITAFHVLLILPNNSPWLLNCAIFDSSHQTSSAINHHVLSILPSNHFSSEFSILLTGTALFQAIIVCPLGMDSIESWIGLPISSFFPHPPICHPC